LKKRLRWHWRRPQSTSWRVDETYVNVRGRWTYLYRAVDKFGNTIDFYLSPTRNTKAAKRFLGKALNGLKDWEKPTVINTDKAPTYGIPITELKVEGKCPGGRRRLNQGADALVSLSGLSCADRHGDALPCCDSVGAKFSMICGREMFAMEKKEIGDLAMD
jgi:transposase-like protein